MKCIKIYLLALSATLLMINPLPGQEAADRVPLNDQAMSVSTYFAILDKKAAEQETTEENQNVSKGEEERVTNGMNPRNTSHNSSNHIFQGVTAYFDQVKLEDESYWMVRPEDRWMLREWIPGDIIAITQADHHWWQFRTDKYIYALYNERTRHLIDVEISAAPTLDSFYRRWIENIYKGHGNAYLVLNDKSVWPLSESERMIWQKWQEGHTIIIGINNSWWNWQSPNILINIHDTYVPVQSGCRN